MELALYARINVAFRAAGLLLVLSTGLTESDAGESTDAADEVLAAWRERQTETSSIQFDCKVSRMYAKDSLSQSSIIAPASESAIPPHDVVLKMNVRYVVHENKIFYSEVGDSWAIESNSRRPNGFSCAFTGTESRMLFAKNDGICPAGELWHDDRPTDTLIAHVNTLALVLIYRPMVFLEQLGADPHSGRVDRPREYHQSGTSKTLVFPRGTDGQSYVDVSVDPTHGYVPVRYVLRKSGYILSDTEISVSEDEAVDACPRAWSWKQFDDSSRLVQTGEVQVLSSEINDPVADDVFEIVFPVGTWVNEHDADGTKIFLVAKDGTRRYLDDSEADLRRYDELMNPRSRWNPFVVITVGVIFLVAAITVLSRSGRGKRASS